MICPNCNTVIPHGKDSKIKQAAKALRKEGYSYREIEQLILAQKGVSVAPSTISRWLNPPKRKP